MANTIRPVTLIYEKKRKEAKRSEKKRKEAKRSEKEAKRGEKKRKEDDRRRKDTLMIKSCMKREHKHLIA